MRAGLKNGCTPSGYRGFEFHLLRFAIFVTSPHDCLLENVRQRLNRGGMLIPMISAAGFGFRTSRPEGLGERTGACVPLHGRPIESST
jgi:hypothetical protein